jgi:hypothetical protein
MFTKSLVFLAVASLMVLWFGFQKLSANRFKPETALQPASLPVINVNPQKLDTKSLTEGKTKEAVSELMLIEDSIEQGLGQIANRFSADVKYPDTSYPIFDPSILPKYQPNLGAPVVSQQGEQLITLTTDAFSYAPDANVYVDVQLENIFEGELLLQVTQSNLVIYETVHQIDYSQLLLTIPPIGQQWINQDVLVAVTVNTQENSFVASTPVKIRDLTDTPISLLRFDASFIDGPWLSIPAKVDVKENGFYRLEANLYSDATGLPLIHLTAENELLIGQGDIFLRAHISALRAMGDPGDYLLKDLYLERMPSDPDYETKTGSLAIKQQRVDGFAFDQYRNEEFQDEEVQARLEFLTTPKN